ncbi:MAG: amidohydrolase family protein [Brucella sp.]
MKIICVEEHLSDPDLTAACRDKVLREAPYTAYWGKTFTDTAAETDHSRPLLTSTGYVKANIGLDAKSRLAEMDKNGLDMQILSYTFTSSPHLLDKDEALPMAQRANDRLAKIVRAHPTRFGGFATVPWQVPTEAAAEITRAIRDLGLNAVMLNGRPGATFLDDPAYEAVLEVLNELKVPLYIHPGVPMPVVRDAYYSGFEDEVSARLSMFGWGWHNESGVQVVRLILSGAFDRWPNLQIISGHWGEMVPFFLQRMDDMLPPELTGLSRTISETYRAHVFVTPSGMLQIPHFNFINEVLGSDRILFSVDYPYLTMSGATDFLATLPVSEEDKAKISHQNAEKLFFRNQLAGS